MSQGICRKCKKEIEACLPMWIFQKINWMGAGKFAGSYEYEKEYYEDAGLFCSRECLVNYLTQEDTHNDR